MALIGPEKFKCLSRLLMHSNRAAVIQGGATQASVKPCHIESLSLCYPAKSFIDSKDSMIQANRF
jgi:hypothetical protein